MKKFKPRYPSAQTVDDLLAKFRTNSYDEADLISAVDLLAKAGITVDKAEQEELRACLS